MESTLPVVLSNQTCFDTNKHLLSAMQQAVANRVSKFFSAAIVRQWLVPYVNVVDPVDVFKTEAIAETIARAIGDSALISPTATTTTYKLECVSNQIDAERVHKIASTVSCRLLDHFVGKYAVQYPIHYPRYDPGTDTLRIISLREDYEAHLAAYHKTLFDFNRRDARLIFVAIDRSIFSDNTLRNSFLIHYDLICVSTTIGQLNAFHWAISNGVLEYALQNAVYIRSTMSASGKTKGLSLSPISDRSQETTTSVSLSNEYANAVFRLHSNEIANQMMRESSASFLNSGSSYSSFANTPRVQYSSGSPVTVQILPTPADIPRL